MFSTDRDRALRYFSDGQVLCDEIDVSMKNYSTFVRDIDVDKRELTRKKNLMAPSRAFALFCVFCVTYIPLFLLLSLFLPKWIYSLLPILSLISSVVIYTYYNKRVVPLYNEIYQNSIDKATSDIREIIEDLYVSREQYEDALHRIPISIRHPAAMEVMKDSLVENYAHGIDEAVAFYGGRYPLIKKKTDTESLNLVKKINESEECADRRNQMFQDLDTLLDKYS